MHAAYDDLAATRSPVPSEVAAFDNRDCTVVIRESRFGDTTTTNVALCISAFVVDRIIARAEGVTFAMIVD